jgi:hypothetical protein
VRLAGLVEDRVPALGPAAARELVSMSVMLRAAPEPVGARPPTGRDQRTPWASSARAGTATRPGPVAYGTSRRS